MATRTWGCGCPREEHDDPVDALACAVTDVAHAIQRLGNADASTPMGAIEALGATLIEGAAAISAGLGSAGEAIADAIRQRNEVEDSPKR